MDQSGGISILYTSLAETFEKPAYAVGLEQELDDSWELGDTWHQCELQTSPSLRLESKSLRNGIMSLFG